MEARIEKQLREKREELARYEACAAIGQQKLAKDMKTIDPLLSKYEVTLDMSDPYITQSELSNKLAFRISAPPKRCGAVTDRRLENLLDRLYALSSTGKIHAKFASYNKHNVSIYYEYE
ncbi:hypothetical protein EOM86_05195 [Candidatus Nomurabacteria bacterium]|nr:hypothetical protein [Candidatus Nomurabacteria bacterium]